MTLTLADAIRDRRFPPPLPPDRASPAEFATHYSRGQWLPAPHLALMEQACLQAIENGRRVILSVSVRHGKTDYVRWFMAWYLATHPDARVILASHTMSEFFGDSERWRQRAGRYRAAADALRALEAEQ